MSKKHRSFAAEYRQQMADVVIPRDLFADILRRIDRLRPPPAPA